MMKFSDVFYELRYKKNNIPALFCVKSNLITLNFCPPEIEIISMENLYLFYFYLPNPEFLKTNKFDKIKKLLELPSTKLLAKNIIIL